MGFRINTNVMALGAHATGTANNRNVADSLEKLSSGLRINKAADDASGLAIANSLRSQANSLGQAIKNANDGIGIMQTADKAIDEQSKILDTIKTKATQAAQDGQTEDTRKAIQKDITKLMEELDNIAETTSFNGQSLLSGQYTDKKIPNWCRFKSNNIIRYKCNIIR
jgi:flagellin